MPAIVRELTSGEPHHLREVSLIGRGEGTAVHLTDASVSRHHASIRHEDASFWIVDLGSANGTFVNGIAVTHPRALRHGDRLRFGNAVLLFEESDPTSSRLLDEKTQISRLLPEPARGVSVTMLVADLKGFSFICALLMAEQVADLLREWYADCDMILKRQGATIDKFIGDGVFAYWDGTDMETREKALLAAQALRDAEAMPTSPTRVLLRSRHGIGLDCRVGIHLGEAAVGAMGRGINTALGDAVNVAFRIEALTRAVDQAILVSAAFVDGWPEQHHRFACCGRHAIKGHADQIEVFAVR
jgi:adenylate cyclase